MKIKKRVEKTYDKVASLLYDLSRIHTYTEECAEDFPEPYPGYCHIFLSYDRDKKKIREYSWHVADNEFPAMLESFIYLYITSKVRRNHDIDPEDPAAMVEAYNKIINDISDIARERIKKIDIIKESE